MTLGSGIAIAGTAACVAAVAIWAPESLKYMGSGLGVLLMVAFFAVLLGLI
jgi:hypothetical protein